MQTSIRTPGRGMDASDFEMFIRAHEDGKLLKSETSGHVLAALTLRAAPSLHGSFINLDSEECAEYRK
jgi:hypothetical protein